jgi:hypothetical protein
VSVEIGSDQLGQTWRMFFQVRVPASSTT